MKSEICLINTVTFFISLKKYFDVLHLQIC